jgi:hypothetical protein
MIGSEEGKGSEADSGPNSSGDGSQRHDTDSLDSYHFLIHISQTGRRQHTLLYMYIYYSFNHDDVRTLVCESIIGSQVVTSGDPCIA